MNKEKCQICYKEGHGESICPKVGKEIKELKGVKLGFEGLVVKYLMLDSVAGKKIEELNAAKETLNEQQKIIEKLGQENERLIKNKEYSPEIANNRFYCYFCLKKLNCEEMLACILNDGLGKILLCNLCLKIGWSKAEKTKIEEKSKS